MPTSHSLTFLFDHLTQGYLEFLDIPGVLDIPGSPGMGKRLKLSGGLAETKNQQARKFD